MRRAEKKRAINKKSERNCHTEEMRRAEKREINKKSERNCHTEEMHGAEKKSNKQEARVQLWY